MTPYKHAFMISEFQEADRPFLRDIYLQCRTETFHWLDASAYQPEDFDRDTKGELILVAEQDGVVLGFIAAWVPNNFIHHLYIHPDAVRKGWGRQLLSACEARLDKPIRLKCLEKNQAGLAFYLAQGWIEEFKDGDGSGTFWTMRKE